MSRSEGVEHRHWNELREPGATYPHREILPPLKLRDAAVSGTIASSQTREEIAMDLQHIDLFQVAAFINAIANLMAVYYGRQPVGGSGSSSRRKTATGRRSRTRR